MSPSNRSINEFLLGAFFVIDIVKLRYQNNALSLINCVGVTTFVFVAITSLTVAVFRDNNFTAVPPYVSDLPGKNKVLCQGGCELCKLK